jgi:hypothetical protein
MKTKNYLTSQAQRSKMVGKVFLLVTALRSNCEKKIIKEYHNDCSCVLSAAFRCTELLQR